MQRKRTCSGVSAKVKEGEGNEVFFNSNHSEKCSFWINYAQKTKTIFSYMTHSSPKVQEYSFFWGGGGGGGTKLFHQLVDQT